MANIYDVARLAKVSTATVSKVLSNTPYVSAQTKERVLKAVRELQYTPSLAARGLTGNRTYVLGLVIPYDPEYLFADPFLLEVIRGVESVANENDYNVLLSMAKKSDQRSAYTRLLRTGYVDGAITVETFEGDAAGRELEERGLPRVSIGYRDSVKPINLVHSDDYRGAYEAVNHLLSLGHRRIGVISGPANFMGAMNERLRGVKDALAAYGQNLDEKLLTYGDFTLESGYAACEPLLENPERPTAIFAMNDRMAAGAMRRIREHGLTIPADISLVGFDDVPLTVLVEPALTTIRQPGVEQGRVAAQKLFELINNDIQQFDPVTLPVSLIVRESTAPPSK
ncbi:MAG TPA: LacI family DNA-binding transcriptional regulator [Chloroflexia bacterium]|nr:LacI family DNA-binding transcriptional regulator [Chloroflexia bacterium]